ncbi:MAG: M28 family peptidase [Anaerolineae bacterium]|nr:M28 family peptidase [Anaerolineae bacterium]
MRVRFLSAVVFLVLLVSLTGNARAITPQALTKLSLVYVELSTSDDIARFASTQLPMVAILEEGLLSTPDSSGLLALDKAGLNYQILDSDLKPGSYYQAQTLPGRVSPDYSAYGQLLLTLDGSVLLLMDPSKLETLTQAGAEVRAITLTPKPLPSIRTELVFPDAIEPDPLIQLMIDQVSTDHIYQYDQGLAGEIPVWVDGAWYTITSRRTDSNLNIQKATSYFGQHLSDLGMEVEYQVWNNSTNPNVIGEIQGLYNPEDIFIIGGHIDDVQRVPAGADDNASGTVAAMIAADILSQFQWGCTLRFAAWTGEEQGLLGSDAYAHRAYQRGENILGYLNLDMIAWNTINTSQSIYLGYGSSVPGSLDLANLFSDVVNAYHINLQPTIGTRYLVSSDHGSFISHGYPAILGIEGEDDFNPYYHSSQDTSTNTNRPYFTDFVRASVATFAQMSGCLIPDPGTLDGHVTTAIGGNPIVGATVTADDDQGRSFSATTDNTGYYNISLRAGTYAVTADAYGYDPVIENNVNITADAITTHNYELISLPTYSVSGYVYDSAYGVPLSAELQFTDAPVLPVNTNENGFYNVEVAEGTWHLTAFSPSHRPITLEVAVQTNVAQDFNLGPLPCILLVDDDRDNPNVRTYYTAALDNLGYSYDVWNILTVGNPSADNLFGYRQVVWFTGYPFTNTFNNVNEEAVKEYLDRGGNLFLSSQNYLYVMGVSPFAQNYLHIASFVNDVSQTSVTGQNVFGGLGPYSLSYPFNNYSDVVVPDDSANVAFTGNKGNAAVSYAGNTFNTVFLGYPFEAISSLANRSLVLERAADFFGGCEPPVSASINPPTQQNYGEPGTQVIYEFAVTNIGDYMDTFTMGLSGDWIASLPAGDSTGPLASGESLLVTVIVSVPEDALPGSGDRTILSVSSTLDPDIMISAKMVTIAGSPPYYYLFPWISR